MGLWLTRSGGCGGGRGEGGGREGGREGVRKGGGRGGGRERESTTTLPLLPAESLPRQTMMTGGGWCSTVQWTLCGLRA